MDEMARERMRHCAPQVLESLRKKGFDPHFFETAEEAGDFIAGQISPGESVGIGGSVTLRQGLDIAARLNATGCTVVDHWQADGNREARLALKRQQRQVDVFLTGVNAMTRTGTIVNLDGGGNRVASSLSGPKRVIAVLGVNKLVDSLDSAITRTRQEAAVLNAVRLKVDTPCARTGICTDCSSPARICAALLILMKRPNDIDTFSVVMVNAELGY